MNKFKLQLNNKTIAKLAGVDHLPDAPIKSLQIVRNVGIFDMETCINIVRKYRATVETLKLVDLKLSFYEMKMMLTKMDNLRDLELKNVEMITECVSQIKLPNLKSLKMFVYCDPDRYEDDDEYGDFGEPDEILNSLKYNSSIEKLEYYQTCDSRWSCTSRTSFTEFTKTTPNIKHLKLEGFRADDLLYDLPLKLETLHTESLDLDDNTLFLGNEHFPHLKELRLRNLPFNDVAILETIFDNTNLESFSLAGVALIKNYELAHVDKELTVCSDYDFKLALEILKRGRCKWKKFFFKYDISLILFFSF
jgi:hypothetical protein